MTNNQNNGSVLFVLPIQTSENCWYNSYVKNGQPLIRRSFSVSTLGPRIMSHTRYRERIEGGSVRLKKIQWKMKMTADYHGRLK